MLLVSTDIHEVTWCLRTYIGLRPYMVNVYIKERINDQITICAGGVTSNTTYLGISVHEIKLCSCGISAQQANDYQETSLRVLAMCG